MEIEFNDTRFKRCFSPLEIVQLRKCPIQRADETWLQKAATSVSSAVPSHTTAQKVHNVSAMPPNLRKYFSMWCSLISLLYFLCRVQIDRQGSHKACDNVRISAVTEGIIYQKSHYVLSGLILTETLADFDMLSRSHLVQPSRWRQWITP